MESTGESAKERWDRNFGELLQELRVAQTGVQILLAFLLTVPFSARFFEETDRLERGIYVSTIVTSVTAMALLVAPVSYHRMVFRQGRKPELVVTANRMAQAGLFAMLVSVVGAVYLALDVVIGLGWASGIVAVLAGAYIFLWYVMPVLNGRS
jgi:Family of unknown function (DUF6328)